MEKKKLEAEKSSLHPRNKHKARYDFKALTESLNELKDFVFVNKYGDESIDFANPDAVKTLNKSLLKHFYQIDFWDIPDGYLCPPIPGRADYIHYAADLLASCNAQNIPNGKKISVLDVGVGANCVYPIIGNREYGWQFIGSEIDSVAVQSAKNIIEVNLALKNNVEIRLQPSKSAVFNNIIHKQEKFDLTICNPPFHASALITESKLFKNQCFWFTSLVSKSENLGGIYAMLNRAEVAEIRTSEMSTGNKITRIVAWTFLNAAQQQDWVKGW
ncbi:MAG: 23S rRNA (adenine(1618)-N(6))-methyltransferase RlmF [Pedobacter sp.]|nr:MAG: 23S rRNA (adenine(1618)-N(6))-methyltransferase RlmF [Pedobacter sp.]